MKNLLVLLIFIIISFQCKDKSKISSQSDSFIVDHVVSQRIDSALNSFVQNEKIAGVSALIYEKDKEVYFGKFGMADRENNVPMSRNTIVQIYSMTKPITGVALMTLYEEGKFDLDDPVEKYAPEFKDIKVCVKVDEEGQCILEDPKRPMTIRDLTRHTSGLPNSNDIAGVGPLLAASGIRNPDISLTEMAEIYGKLPLYFHPGEKWSYGPSVDIQAFLVERISGVPFDQYIQEKIFDPLEMKETGYVVSEENLSRFAAVYRRSEEEGDYTLARIPDEDIHAFNLKKWKMTPGGYGLTSTIDDYMKFARMLVHKGSFNDQIILQPETVELMATNQLDENITDRMWLPSKGQVGFGIDFAVRLREPASAEENNGVVGEFFWDGAASTLFWVDPVNELTAVLFVQLMPFDGIGLHKGFRDAVYGLVK